MSDKECLDRYTNLAVDPYPTCLGLLLWSRINIVIQISRRDLPTNNSSLGEAQLDVSRKGLVINRYRSPAGAPGSNYASIVPNSVALKQGRKLCRRLLSLQMLTTS